MIRVFVYGRWMRKTLDLAGASFNAVVANHMLYHVEDRPQALAEIRRVLKPGGKLFAATNSDSHLAKIRQLLDEFLAGRSRHQGRRHSLLTGKWRGAASAVL